MKTTLPSFYKSFYGHSFFRHFRRPPDFDNRKFRVQFTVKNAKELYLHIQRNSGFYPCYIQTYDRGSPGNLRRNKPGKILFDRAYFDFDVHHLEAKSLKDILQHLRSHGLNHVKNLQNKLENRLRHLIIDEKIAKPAIDEAKDFAKRFKKEFGKYPALFFSGCKGCHAYTFFEPVQLIDFNRTITYFAEQIKETYNYQTLDLAVNRDASSRLSRVPYSKHQLTDLTVVPFKVTDPYHEIIAKSLDPFIEPFSIGEHLTRLDEHLKAIDEILEYNAKIETAQRKARFKHVPEWYGDFKNLDHRTFFKQILGEPAYVSPNKPYMMYNCPFHEDNHPSFMVHKTGYKCYGCGKKGNYWQFLKDYNGWNDKEVKNYLKTCKANKKSMGVVKV